MRNYKKISTYDVKSLREVSGGKLLGSNKDEKVFNLAVSSLNQIYKAGDNIEITDNNEISGRDWLPEIKFVNNKVNSISSNIKSIQEIIPENASKDNQLADKTWTEEKIAVGAGRYLTKDGVNPFDSYIEFQMAAARNDFWYGTQHPVELTNNDYILISEDEEHDYDTTRYMYSNDVWEYQYKINSSPYVAGPNIKIENNVISGKNWTNDISSAVSSKLDTTAFKEVSSTFLTIEDIANKVDRNELTISANWNNAYSAVTANSGKWSEPYTAGQFINISNGNISVTGLDEVYQRKLQFEYKVL